MRCAFRILQCLYRIAASVFLCKRYEASVPDDYSVRTLRILLKIACFYNVATFIRTYYNVIYYFCKVNLCDFSKLLTDFLNGSHRNLSDCGRLPGILYLCNRIFTILYGIFVFLCINIHFRCIENAGQKGKLRPRSSPLTEFNVIRLCKGYRAIADIPQTFVNLLRKRLFYPAATYFSNVLPAESSGPS